MAEDIGSEGVFEKVEQEVLEAQIEEAGPRHDPERFEKVALAARAWVEQLIDIGGRNNLLYFRHLKVGTLDLTDADPVALTALLSDRRVRASNLFPGEDRLADSARRLRAIRRKANENFEERGIDTLYIGAGIAVWRPVRTSIPSAPILLAPVSAIPRGSSEDDFDLALDGDWSINPTLIHLLQVEFSCEVEAERLLEELPTSVTEDFNPSEVFNLLEKSAEAVSDFKIEAEQTVLANFSYAKQPMVADIQSNIDALVEHDLIAAIAGDSNARGLLTGQIQDVDVASPNFIPPEDEFLILPADSSQSYAIKAVVGGESLVIDGPPGTGKSQTISNLIATLIGRDKKVLFVAEKRAAIDAVLKRLQGTGIEDFIMDVHEGTKSRRRIAQGIAAALRAAGRTPPVDVGDTHRSLAARRQQLVEHDVSLHVLREPWGISMFETQSRLLGLESSIQTLLRFRGDQLSSLGKDNAEAVRMNLREFAALGGLTLTAEDSPWFGAAVTSSDEAQNALTLASRIGTLSLPNASELLRQVLDQTGLTPPSSVADWKDRLALISRVRKTLTTFLPKIYDFELSTTVTQFDPARRSGFRRFWARLSSSNYRSARKLLRQVCIPKPPKTKVLFEAARVALLDRDLWSSHQIDAGKPRLPNALDGAMGAFDQLSEELRALGAYVTAADFQREDPHSLKESVESLARDSATLFKLPRLHELRTHLERFGVTPLINEMSARGVSVDSAIRTFDHAWLWSILEHVAGHDVRVGAFDGALLHRTVDEYQKTDEVHMESNGARIRRLCAERAVVVQDQFKEQRDLISKEAAKTRRHLPLRELFQRAADVLTGIKPCWVMSPLVVSQILPSDRRYFDVVIFDEASQIPPADAVPAILRAQQAVVAGDEKQLPPTSFFSVSVPDSEATEEVPMLALTSDIESILEAMRA